MREVGPSRREKVPPKIYTVMTVTTALTFATLTTAYQLLFARSPFA